MISETRDIIVRDVEIFYAKLDKPVTPFGNEARWEVQIRTSDKSVADQWTKEYELNVKKQDDYWKVNLKRPLLNRNKEENEPPQVVDASRTPITGSNLGNGSKGNVKLFQYPYDVAGRKGTGSQLKAIQITDLKIYEPDTSIDFEVLEEPTAKEASF